MTPIVGVRAHHKLGRSLGRDPCHGSHPIVGGIVHASCWSIFGRWVSYSLPPLCGAVLLVWHGIGMAPDSTMVTTVPLVIVRSVRHAYSCQSKHTEPCSISPCPAHGS